MVLLISSSLTVSPVRTGILKGRTNGDTLKAFEMNIFHYEPFSTVYGGAAKQQRRYEQLFIAIVIMRSS